MGSREEELKSFFKNGEILLFPFEIAKIPVARKLLNEGLDSKKVAEITRLEDWFVESLCELEQPCGSSTLFKVGDMLVLATDEADLVRTLEKEFAKVQKKTTELLQSGLFAYHAYIIDWLLNLGNSYIKALRSGRLFVEHPLLESSELAGEERGRYAKKIQFAYKLTKYGWGSAEMAKITGLDIETVELLMEGRIPEGVQ